VTGLVRALVRLLVVFIVTVVGASIASTVAAFLLRGRLADHAQPEDDDLYLAAILEARQYRSEATAFRGGRVICWNAGARLEAWTAFGGLRVVVPEAWRVRMSGLAVFGGATSAAPEPDDADEGPVLEVAHRTIFSGFGVVAEPDDEVLLV